jgi:hypothetical protein
MRILIAGLLGGTLLVVLAVDNSQKAVDHDLALMCTGVEILLASDQFDLPPAEGEIEMVVAPFVPIEGSERLHQVVFGPGEKGQVGVAWAYSSSSTYTAQSAPKEGGSALSATCLVTSEMGGYLSRVSAPSTA